MIFAHDQKNNLVSLLELSISPTCKICFNILSDQIEYIENSSIG